MSVEAFAQFWAAYPQRKGNPKKPAYDVWARLEKAGELPSLDVMIAAAKAYAAQCKAEKTDPKYIAHTRTWLFQQRWNEFAPKVVAGGDKEAKNGSPLEIPVIMSRVFEVLGPERYQARFSGCAFETIGDEVIVIRPKYRYEIERLESGPADLVERLTKRRVRVEMAA